MDNLEGKFGQKSFRLLPTVTTITKGKWKDKLSEINEFGLEEVAFFPTCLGKRERNEFYNLAKKSCIKKIPYVHLRSDMNADEAEYLIREFGTERFNLHTVREFFHDNDYSRFKNMVFVENVYYPLDEKEVEKYGGVCVDFSHLENDKMLYNSKYKHNVGIIEKHRIGCNHLSPIWKDPSEDKGSVYDRLNIRYDSHECRDLSEFDYLKNYPAKYFSDCMAIEIENTIEFQLKAKEYLENLISHVA